MKEFSKLYPAAPVCQLTNEKLQRTASASPCPHPTQQQAHSTALCLPLQQPFLHAALHTKIPPRRKSPLLGGWISVRHNRMLKLLLLLLLMKSHFLSLNVICKPAAKAFPPALFQRPGQSSVSLRLFTASCLASIVSFSSISFWSCCKWFSLFFCLSWQSLHFLTHFRISSFRVACSFSSSSWCFVLSFKF